MPSVSKKQQKFMGIVRAIQKGEADPSDFNKDAQDAAKKMKKTSVKKYAKTKHKGLPTKKVKESLTPAEVKKERELFKKTGELPPRLQKVVDDYENERKAFKWLHDTIATNLTITELQIAFVIKHLGKLEKTRELRNKGQMKIISLAPEVL